MSKFDKLDLPYILIQSLEEVDEMYEKMSFEELMGEMNVALHEWNKVDNMIRKDDFDERGIKFTEALKQLLHYHQNKRLK